MLPKFTTAVVITSLLATATAFTRLHAHEDYEAFSAGEPGDLTKPARVVLVTMREGGGKMMYIPDRIEVRKDEQIRFLLSNVGELDHEFRLARTEDNLKHAELMKKHPRHGA